MKYVLFVCTHNAGRSQIAQAFFERYAPADIRAESAGEEPASKIWPNVIEATREVGIDISHRRPKKLDVEMQLHADWAITLHCKASCPFVASQVEDWEVDDPAGEPLERLREIRDEIEQRVRDFVETRLDGRPSHAGHLRPLFKDRAGR
jgi:arsenate reductase